jgi:AraC family transcriptional regulator
VNPTPLPPVQHARPPFVGTGQTVRAVWDRLFGEWLPQSGYQPDDRPVMEIYRGEAMDHATGAVTCELCVAVRPL